LITSKEWAAVIVGGGPAGAAMAIRLARLGHEVLLLDRDEFPRPKPCGECLSPAAVRELDDLGLLPLVLALPHQRLAGWKISAPSGRGFDGSFPSPHFGVAVQRSLLDHLLLREASRAGVQVCCGERVADLLWAGSRVVGVRTGTDEAGQEIHARLVVGADGLRSVVVRRLGLIRRQPRLKKLALTAHVRGDGAPLERGELHVLPDGCIGIASVGGGLSNLTVVLSSGQFAAEVAGGRDEFFDQILAGHPRFASLQRQDDVLATGPFDWPVRSAVADGAILIGDAAGYYDPFTGQGVFRALRGAAIAAKHVDPALNAGYPAMADLAGYERERRRAFAAGERLQHLIEAVVARERVIDFAAGRLRAAPALADALVAVAADIHPVRSLLNPRLLRQSA